jgi:hypothetical protein
MRTAALASLLGAVALAGCASGHAKPAAQVKGAPSVTSLNEAQAEIAVARASNSSLFRIFPTTPGERRCAIPAGAGLIRSTIEGQCRTSVWYPHTHGHGEARVVFRESWGNGRVSSWSIWEELPTRKVLVTKLHGRLSPQIRAAESE